MTTTGKLGDVMTESIPGGEELCSLALRRFRHPAAAVRQDRHPRPRAGGRDAERRPVGRCRHDHVDRLGDDRRSRQGTIWP